MFMWIKSMRTLRDQFSISSEIANVIVFQQNVVIILLFIYLLKMKNDEVLSDFSLMDLKTPICLYSSQSYNNDHFIKFGRLITSNDILIITNDNIIKRHCLINNKTKFTFNESNHIYDYAILNNDCNSDESLLFICSKDNPIRSIKLSNGSGYESYIIKNHLDNIINPIFVSVDDYGLNLYCGGAFIKKIDLITNKQLSITLPYKQMASCYSFNFMNSAYLIGSYDKTILIYDYKSDTFIEEYKQSCSVNQIVFSMRDANYFYVGYRNSNSMKLFDMRMMDQYICEWYRDTKTSQKINFCFDKEEKYLFTGGVNGNCLGYDLINGTCLCQFIVDEGNECVNSVDYLNGLLLTTTGQRHFDVTQNNNKLSASSSDNDDDIITTPQNSQFKLWKLNK